MLTTWPWRPRAVTWSGSTRWAASGTPASTGSKRASTPGTWSSAISAWMRSAGRAAGIRAPAPSAMLPAGALARLPVLAGGWGAGVAGWCRTVLRVVGRGWRLALRCPRRRLARVVARARIRPRFTTSPARPGMLRAGMLRAGALARLPVLGGGWGAGLAGWCRTVLRVVGRGTRPALRLPGRRRLARVVARAPIRQRFTTSPAMSGDASGGRSGSFAGPGRRLGGGRGGLVPNSAPRGVPGDAPGPRLPGRAVSHGSWLGRRSGHDSRHPRHVRGCFGRGCFRRALWVFCRFWPAAGGRALAGWCRTVLRVVG